VVQPDGKLLLTGGFYTGDFYYGAYIIRLNANGTVDNAFGRNGGVYSEIFNSVGDNIALQADGETVFTSPNLKSLNFILPAKKLENRTYIIFLEGQNAQNPAESVTEYSFRVRR